MTSRSPQHWQAVAEQPAAQPPAGPAGSQGGHPLETARVVARLREVSKWGGRLLFFGIFAFSARFGAHHEKMPKWGEGRGRVSSESLACFCCGITEI